MRRKVSSDWLPSYIKVTRPVLEILNMAGYFPDRPRSLTNLKHEKTKFKVAPKRYLNTHSFHFVHEFLMYTDDL